jgi:hypothetical protein
MDENLNKLLIAEIQKRLPEGKRIVAYLMEVLGLGKESIYRRLRNNISFTLDEIIKLSTKLGFSIDEVVGQSNSKRVFFDIPASDSTDPLEIYSEYMKDTAHIIKRVNKVKGSRVIAAYNRLPIGMTVPLKNLSRFIYFRWLHQTHNIPLNFLLSDIHISSEAYSLYSSFHYNFLKMGEMTVILDENIFDSLIGEMLYYYKRDIIKKEELMVLKEELNQIIDRIEILTEKGVNDVGSRINIFISSFRIESTYCCYEYDDNIYTQIWSYIMSPITINKHEICTIHKKRVEAYKKFSILITQCNEIQRSEYLNKQRKLIANMGLEIV